MDRRVKERLIGAAILAVLVVSIVPAMLSGPKPRIAPVQLPSATGPSEAVRNVTVDLATSKATPADPADGPAEKPAENAPADSAASAASSAAQGTTGASAEAPGDSPVASAASGAEPAPVEALPAPGRAGSANRSPGRPTIATLKAQQPAHLSEPRLEREPSAPRSRLPESTAGGAESVPSTGATNHRWSVQVGSFASRENAERLVRQLKTHDGSLYVSSSGKGAALRYRVRIGPLSDRDTALRVVAKLKREGQSASLVAP